MFPGLRRLVSTWAILLVAYLAYSWLAVPFIEVPFRPRPANRTAPPPTTSVQEFTQWFPPGSWERDRPKVVETEQGTLLFADYRPLPDGQIELLKCSVIAYVEQTVAEPSGGPPLKQRRPVIIRAPQGARLQFDQPMDLLRAEFGRLLGGTLSGEVTVHSPPSREGADDALELTTRQLQITSTKIWTPHEVQFRYGPNEGRGRVLTLYLNSEKQRGADDPHLPVRSGLGIGGVRQLELEHLDELRLYLANEGVFGRPSSPSRPPQSTPRATSARGAQGPGPEGPGPGQPTVVQVTAQGPLVMSLAQQLVTLVKQVQVQRAQGSGAKDSLRCERLDIYFSGGEKLADFRTERQGSPSSSRLAATRVVATGNPATIEASSLGIGTRAEQIEYDLLQQRIWLRDSRDKVLFHDRQREVEAAELWYQLGEGNRLGQLWARGPGTVVGQTNAQGRTFAVHWQGEVDLTRVQEEPVLSFHARSRIAVTDWGEFTGDLLRLYLREVPRAEASDRFEVVPDRLHAIGNVVAESPTWQATLREAKVWFRQPDAAADTTTEDDLQATNQRAQPAAFWNAEQEGGEARPRSRYVAQAEQLEAVVQMGKRPAPRLVIVRGNVTARELAPAEAFPLEMVGDHLELQEGHTEHPRIALLGQPARVSARGLMTEGPRYHVHPADNFVEIVGAGNLRVLPRPTTESVTAPLESSMDWEGKMQFDGQVARFEKRTVARSARRNARGEVSQYVATGELLQASLQRPIDFRHPQANGPAALEEIVLDGWGFLRAEITDSQGTRQAVHQAQLQGLRFHQPSGELRGQGPGWLRGIQRQTGAALTVPGVPAGPDANGLHFLRVDFTGDMRGNSVQQWVQFRHQVRTLYSPVQSWDDAPDQEGIALSPQGFRLSCDQLTAAQPPGAGQEAFELEAVGNAFVEGTSFTASGGRVSYARQKDQLVLEGDERNFARIETRQQPGQRPSTAAARKLLYWPSTGRMEAVGLQPIELYDLGQLRGRSPVNRQR